LTVNIEIIGICALVILTIIGWIIKAGNDNKKAHTYMHEKINKHTERLVRIETTLKIKDNNKTIGG